MGQIGYYFDEFQRASIMYLGFILLLAGFFAFGITEYRKIVKISEEEERWNEDIKRYEVKRGNLRRK